MIIGLTFDIIHLILMFVPFVLLFLKTNYLQKYVLAFKILFLLFILVPVHWMIFNDECLLTMISKKHGTVDDTSNAFTKKYLSFIYYPILRFFNLPITDKYIEKLIGIHWVLLLSCFWYVICIKLK